MNIRLLRVVLGLAAIGSSAILAAAYSSTPPITWHGGIEVATGSGLRGPWQQNASHYDYVDDPTIAVNDQGEIAVAWVEQRLKDVFFQRFDANGTSQLDRPLNVSRNPESFSWLPRIVVSPHSSEQVFILWQEIIFSGGSHGGDILFSRSTDGGLSFSEPINLSQSVGGDGKGRINRKIWHNGSLDLAAGDDGTLYAAWTEYDGPLWLSRSTDGGNSFAPPQLIAGGGDALPARAPSLATGSDGTLYLVWTVGEDKTADIRLAKSTNGGANFGKPLMVAPSESYSDAPKLATDPDGVLHLVYAESASGPFARYHIRYTRSFDDASTFEPSRRISDPAPFSAESSAFPAINIDPKGNLYVLWELFPNHRQRPQGLALVVSQDGGRNFTTPRRIPGSKDPAGGTNGSHQGLLMNKLSVGGTGDFIVVANSSLKLGEYSRVWLMRGKLASADQ